MASHAKAKNIGRGGASRPPLRGGRGLGDLPARRAASGGAGRAKFGRATSFQKLR